MRARLAYVAILLSALAWAVCAGSYFLLDLDFYPSLGILLLFASACALPSIVLGVVSLSDRKHRTALRIIAGVVALLASHALVVILALVLLVLMAFAEAWGSW